MNEPVWVLPDVVLAIHQMLLAEHGGSSGIRDEAMLDSALHRPKQHFVYDEEVTIWDIAASYSYGIAKNHPFIDGNKRTALTIGAVFLELNGYSLNAPEAEAVLIFEQLAAGNISQNILSKWYEESSSANA